MRNIQSEMIKLDFVVYCFVALLLLLLLLLFSYYKFYYFDAKFSPTKKNYAKQT